MNLPSKLITASDYKEWLGPFPILTSEDPKRFEMILEQVASALAPSDFMEANLVYEYVCGSWEVYRWDRHQTLAIERRYKRTVAACEKGLAAEKGRHEAEVLTRAVDLAVTPTDIGHALALEEKVLSAVGDVDKILEATTTELAHNHAMAHVLEFLTAASRLRLAATKRRNDALQLYEHYRQGLASLLKRVTEDAIIADSTRHDAPSIVAPDGEVEPSNAE
jgi:hypothetical protein